MEDEEAEADNSLAESLLNSELAKAYDVPEYRRLFLRKDALNETYSSIFLTEAENEQKMERKAKKKIDQYGDAAKMTRYQAAYVIANAQYVEKAKMAEDCRLPPPKDDFAERFK